MAREHPDAGRPGARDLRPLVAQAPVVGFVNEDKLEVAGVVQPARVAMLRDWLDAGAELGNHTHGHVDLHAVGVPAYEDAILKGERQLRPLLAERGAGPRWFRHPYLRAGRTFEIALRPFLDTAGEQPGGLYVVRVAREGRVEALRDAQDLPVDALRIEGVPLGAFYPESGRDRRAVRLDAMEALRYE